MYAETSKMQESDRACQIASRFAKAIMVTLNQPDPCNPIKLLVATFDHSNTY